jgi:hypothetical protein
MKKKAVALLCFLVSTVGCIHKQSGSITPWERVNTNLAALAEINADVAKGIIAVQQAEIITPQQAAPILQYQETVAKDHMAIENIFGAGSARASAQAVQIEGLLNEIKSQGMALIQSGGLGVKNPKSQQTFTQDLQGIVNLAELVLADYRVAKGN